MSYTKGNWELDIQTGNIRADGHLVAQVYGATVHNHEKNYRECMANARLVLNAPAMLHALRKASSALAMCRYCEVLAGEIQELIDSVEEAETC